MPADLVLINIPASREEESQGEAEQISCTWAPLIFHISLRNRSRLQVMLNRSHFEKGGWHWGGWGWWRRLQVAVLDGWWEGGEKHSTIPACLCAGCHIPSQHSTPPILHPREKAKPRSSQRALLYLGEASIKQDLFQLFTRGGGWWCGG